MVLGRFRSHLDRFSSFLTLVSTILPNLMKSISSGFHSVQRNMGANNFRKSTLLL